MTTLEHIAEFAGVPINGDLPIRIRKSRRDLPSVFARAGFTKGAEIGVWQGFYAEELARGIPGVQLLCVDPWRAYSGYNEVKNNQARLDQAYAITKDRLKNLPCVIMRMSSIEAARTVAARSLDFVYLDGNHSKEFVRSDTEAWAPKIRPGGILAGHDYKHSPKKMFIEVKEAIDSYTAEHAIAPWFVLAGDKSPSWFWVVN